MVSVNCSSISGWQVPLYLSPPSKEQRSWAPSLSHPWSMPDNYDRRDVSVYHRWSSYIKTDFWVFEMYLNSLLSIALVGLYKKSSVRCEGSVSSKVDRVKVVPREDPVHPNETTLHSDKELVPKIDH